MCLLFLRQKKIDECLQSKQYRPVEYFAAETDPIYQLTMQANNLSSDVDNEISLVHKVVL